MSTGAPTVAVSFQNADDGAAGVVTSILRSAGLTDTVINALVTDVRTENQRMAWTTSETSRLLNGRAAELLGLPQDERCRSLGEFRRCAQFFDLGPSLYGVDPALRDNLTAAVEGYGRTRELVGFAGLKKVENNLAIKFGHTFVNRKDGAIFASTPPGILQFADVDWRTFYKRNAALVDRAVNLMLGLA